MSRILQDVDIKSYLKMHLVKQHFCLILHLLHTEFVLNIMHLVYSLYFLHGGTNQTRRTRCVIENSDYTTKDDVLRVRRQNIRCVFVVSISILKKWLTSVSNIGIYNNSCTFVHYSEPLIEGKPSSSFFI